MNLNGLVRSPGPAPPYILIPSYALGDWFWRKFLVLPAFLSMVVLSIVGLFRLSSVISWFMAALRACWFLTAAAPLTLL